MAIVLSPWLPVTIIASMVAFYASARGLQDGEAVAGHRLHLHGRQRVHDHGRDRRLRRPDARRHLGIVLQMFAFVLVIVAALIVPPPLRAAEAAAQPA